VLAVTNFFVPAYQGGAEVAAYNTSWGLIEAGHQVRVLSINTRPPQLKNVEYEVGGVPVHEVHLARQRTNRYVQVFDPQVAAILEEEIARFEPDVVHAHNLSGASLAPFWVTARRRVPLVATLHDLWMLCANNMLLDKTGQTCPPGIDGCSYRRCFREYDFWGAVPQRRRLFRWLSRHVHTFISPSRRLIELYVERGYEAQRFTLLRHGLRPLALPSTETPQDIRENYHGAQTMLYVGGIVVSKGIEVVLKALPHLIASIPNFRLVVAGAGPAKYVSQLRSYPDHVTLLGQVPRERMAEVYAGAGLTLMPSVINENSPLSVCESVMAGTPVLGARIGGIPELISENETGYLYEPLDAAELVGKAVAHFERSPQERRSMRRACVAYGKAEFSVEQHVRRLTDLYLAAVKANRKVEQSPQTPAREPVVTGRY
jgi:glycosyltransferase involved in cell wall biosynthesis